MTETATELGAVYVTRGRKYHADDKCPLMVGGEGLWQNSGDSDGWPWQPGTYRTEDPSSQYAAMRGKLPCLHCVPAEQRTFPPLYGQTFGHEPVAGDTEFFGEVSDDKPVCSRCSRLVRKWSSYTVGYDERAGVLWENGWVSYWTRVNWPCTSAVVLGIAPRPSGT